MEYAVAGIGPPLLMIHGTGGGFDQGLLFTEKLAAHGVRVIAPSRFGTAGTAKAIARQMPSSELLVFPDGGHVLLGHDEASARAIALFVKQHQD